MAFPTSVNSQITDAATQSNVKVLGDAPCVAAGNLLIATSQALGNSAHNATASQQQVFSVANAATVQGISTILCVDTAAAGMATQKIFHSDAGFVYA